MFSKYFWKTFKMFCLLHDEKDLDPVSHPGSKQRELDMKNIYHLVGLVVHTNPKRCGTSWSLMMPNLLFYTAFIFGKLQKGKNVYQTWWQ